uniref:non-ribosomal peptide synthetase n=1 Tax=Nocardia takedensis TaxID=259390 RepID=UPI0009FDF64E|nr:non-ribosomal peptide synthetase [Nocardia takedensis]
MTRSAPTRPVRTARARVRTLPHLLATAAETDPHRVAVRFATAERTVGELTYAELDQRSNRLARLLIQRGIGPEDRVAVGIPRSLESVLAVWAVAKTGAAFVPVDPNYPAERVAHMISDSGAVLGLTVFEHSGAVPALVEWIVYDDPAFQRELTTRYSAEPPSNDERTARLRAEHPAYVIYTSGSTGLPKGVVVTQAGIAGYCAEQRARLGVFGDAITLHFSSPSFDASILELLLAVGGAATMVVVAPTVLGGAELAEVLRRERVSHAFCTPGALSTVDPEGLDDLRVVVAGGEGYAPELVRRWAVALPSGEVRAFHNAYGPTEATVATNISGPQRGDHPLTIGTPLAGVSEYILDDRLSSAPAGVVGELYVGGAQVARGYHRQPGLTATRFVADPFGAPGSRLFRTGDLIRTTANGEPEVLGRNDFQVKIRGFRIELGEIDAVLAGHPGLDFAITVGHELDTGTTVLVSYVHAAPGLSVDVDEVIEHARRSLPTHMVPTVVMALDAIPLTPAGKLDRAALPEPRLRERAYRAPETGIEKQVAEVFTELLAPDRPVGTDDDFFDLGGNSLLATRAAARLGADLDTQISPRLLFEFSSVAAFARALAGMAGSGRRPVLTPRPRPELIPLSPAQQRMWFLSRFDPESAVNNIPFAVRLSGTLDTGALRAAVADLLARHETLRTVYPAVDGVGHQRVLPTERALPDLEPRPMGEDELRPWLMGSVLAGFDVSAEVPLRMGLARLAAHEHVLSVVVHHIAADGASVAPMVRDLMTAYIARTGGAAPEFAPLPVQYADYTLWQRELLGDESDPTSLAATQLDYWRKELAGLPERLELPTVRPRPAVASGRGAVHGFEIPADLAIGLRGLALEHGASLFMVVHAGLAVLLARLAATEDVAIGTPVAGRGERELDDLIGMFVNMLVLRTPVGPHTSFVDLVAAVKDTDLRAFSNADVPFERLVEVLDPVRSQAHHPLVQVALFFQNLDSATLALPDLSVEVVEFDGAVAQFDLQITVEPDSAATAPVPAAITYAADLFDADAVADLADRLVRVFAAVVADPERPVGSIELLAPLERDRILLNWNDTGRFVSSELLLDGYRRAAAADPDAVAVVYEGAELTYREFDARVNRVARLLIARGVGAESLVGLAMRRSADLVVGMYAILAAGGAYVPLDPDHPAERIGHILDTARPVCVLSTSADAAALPSGVEVLALDRLDLDGLDPSPVRPEDLVRQVRRDHPAYVIFTSGSTGRPKGVAVPHLAIHNQISWMLAQYPLGPADVYFQKTATTFDVSLWGYFMPLRAGARLVVATPDGHRDPTYVAETIARERVTVTDFVPSMLTVFAAHAPAAALTTLRHVFVIGEALPPETVSAFAAISDAAVHNLYGPTEAAVSVTYQHADAASSGSVPIGLPQWNTQVYVLDSRLRPVPAGVVGELYLAGNQLARGYVRRPDLTADRFVANIFGFGTCMYRTGDLVAWRRGANGEYALDYLGRSDFQVKFRGQRIELGEIETALLAIDAVSQAVAAVVATPTGDQLVGYAVPAPGHRVDADGIRAALADTLPAYMVPNAIVALDAFPLNASGKLDRKALPAPVFAVEEFRAPSTPTEGIVAEVFAEVLGVARVGLDDDFFALGGNSLLAMQVAARLGAALDTTVPVRSLFESTTVVALAADLARSAGSGHTRPPLTAMPRPERIPLSPAQQRYWFLNQYDPAASAVDNIPLAVRLTGTLDVAALGHAIGDVFARHEVLRTRYPRSEDGPHQVVLPAPATAFTLTPIPVRPADLLAKVVEFATITFDVSVDVPVAVALFEIVRAPGELVREHVVAFTVHHVSADGVSMGPLARDVMRAYASRLTGQAPDWSPLPVQYADYALWQRAVLGAEDDPSSVAARQIGYWKSALDGLPEQLDLPSDRPRPAVRSFRGATVRVEISPSRHARLREVALAHNASLFMVCNAALAVLLSRLSGSDDVAVGTPMAGRGAPELDQLIGMFVNTLVFRTRVRPEQRFDALLAAVRARDLEVLEHAEVPFERLVEVLNPVRSAARSPLFQIGLSFQNHEKTSFELPGLTVTGVEFDTGLAKTDLQLTLTDGYAADGAPDVIGAEFTYATDLFDRATVEGFARRYLRVLDAISADDTVAVGAIDILEPEESARVLRTWNATGRATDTSATLVSLLDAAVARFPQRTALVGADGDRITYAELDARVNRLARHLIARGVGPESPVGLVLRRSVDLVVAMYAVARAGGAYVPIDPDQPAGRREHILGAVAPVCVLTTSDTGFLTPIALVIRVDAVDLDHVPAGPITDAERRAPLRAGNTAYIIFTSGSTGVPKGVAVSHGAIVNQLLWKRETFALTPDDAVLLKTAATFDLSVWEFWSAVLCGGRLVIAARDGLLDPGALVAQMAREKVSVLHTVPSLLDALAAGRLPESLRVVLAIGEALPAASAQRIVRDNPRVSLFNAYGPTEAAVSITSHRVGPADTFSVPIGRPAHNSRVYVLDSRLRPVPVGVPGELYLAGAQLARGYVGRAELTADRFVADPFETGARMYRTGDLVVWTSDGELDYRGRTDFQVKVRGVRIELGEIEAALLAVPGIAQVAVVARRDERVGDNKLVAYLVGPGAGEADRVKAALATRLPATMIPSAFVALDALPLNSNGKLERKALPDPAAEARVFRAPSTPVEEIVAKVYGEVLGVESVGADDDFFELGGTSLAAIRAVGMLRTATGADPKVPWFFTDASVSGLGARIQAAMAGAVDFDERSEEALGVVLPIRARGDAPAVFAIHPVYGLSWSYSGFARHIAKRRPLYGLQSPALSESEYLPETLDVIVRRYVEEIRAIQPEGPYHLLGWSLGGVLAHGVAVALQARGARVASLIMLDSKLGGDLEHVRGDIAGLLNQVGVPRSAMVLDGGVDDLNEEALAALHTVLPGELAVLTEQRLRRMYRSALRSVSLVDFHRPGVYRGRLDFFSAEGNDLAKTWQPYVEGMIVDHPVEAPHALMTSPEVIEVIGPVIAAVIDPA